MNDGHTFTATDQIKRLRASAAACCIFAAVAVSGLTTSTFAQTLPDSVVQAPVLDASQKKAVEDFVKPYLPQLKDNAKLRAARQNILERLNTVPNVSPSFRLELWKQLGDTSKEMMKSADEQQIVNGLRLAGEVATDSSVILIPDYLKSKKAPIRFAASFAIMRAFENCVQGKGPAMDRTSAQTLIKAITDAMKIEEDSDCFDSMVRALAAAGAERMDPNIRADALKALAETAAGILHNNQNGLSDQMLEGMIRAMTTIRDSLTAQQNPAWKKESAILSGEGLAYVYRQLRKPGAEASLIKRDDPEDVKSGKLAARMLIGHFVAVSESTANLARGNAQPTNMAAQVRAAEKDKDATALSTMDELLKDKLIKEFALPPNQFIK